MTQQSRARGGGKRKAADGKVTAKKVRPTANANAGGGAERSMAEGGGQNSEARNGTERSGVPGRSVPLFQNLSHE